MTTIIVPVDFSEECMAGLKEAIMLASKMDCKIEMVNVIAGTNYPAGVLQNERLQAEQNFQEILQIFKNKELDNLNLSYIIKEGKVHEEVANQASAYDDALIVMSTHGKSGFEQFFIGSNAYKIASVSKNPVISVRDKKIPNSINRIVMPLNITFHTREKVPYTAKLARLFNAEIKIVTVRTTNLKSIQKKLIRYSNQVSSFLGSQQIPFTVEHLYGNNLTDLTRDYAGSVNADLISIMLEQEESISNLLLGSYAHQMINSASIPVLTFPNYQIGISTGELRTQGIYY